MGRLVEDSPDPGSAELKLQFTPIRVHMGHCHGQMLAGGGFRSLGDTHEIHRQIRNMNESETILGP